jgi:hypothetical protein
MYTLSQLKRAVETPNLLVREVNRLYHTRADRRYNRKGIDIFAEDWDNLLVLDACRYDMFRDQHTLPGRLESRISQGSHTSEFLKANVAGRDLRDTVYVTASPMYYRNRAELNAEFHAVVDVWKEGGWHESHRTVMPETMVSFALDAADRFPDKRLLVHFLQPHYPFVGETGVANFDLDDLAFEWDAAFHDDFEFSDELLWQAFRENLDVALPHVERLMRALPGRTVVSSDHGQMIGERSRPIPSVEYGHPPGTYTKQLTTVPWLVFENGPRKEIRHGESTDDVSEQREETVGVETARSPEREDPEVDDDELVKARLESLGYL